MIEIYGLDGEAIDLYKFYSYVRPDFDPNQIKEISEIKQGMLVLQANNDNMKFPVKVVDSEPYKNEHGDWVINLINPNNPELKLTAYLTDMGVIEYENGMWNSYNALLRVEEE